ncbi:MAG TPA: carbonic anhydrase family protein [Panacibacter sp.]|nr:carbonic anhydrase family protein [Panacibacter sp.]HNP44173.1 carbonic anhydrase family protein [Panacibacter sp.]
MYKKIASLVAISSLFFACQKSAQETPVTSTESSQSQIGYLYPRNPATDSFYESVQGQTPIDIRFGKVVPYRGSDPVFHYVSFNGNVTYNQTHYVADPLNESDPEAHDEYNLKVSVPAGNKDNYITINNTNYYLSQFHFHWRSEHKINGQDGAMEVHLVHASDSGKMAVIGVLIQLGKANEVLQQVFDACPPTTGITNVLNNVNPALLLPTDTYHYFTYSGSLTTPGGGLLVLPYLQGLKWFVYADPIKLSNKQYTEYEDMFPEPNARPVQPLGDRIIYGHLKTNH